jgi:hypothetical protein
MMRENDTKHFITLYEAAAGRHGLPPHTVDGIVNYIVRGCPIGGFLSAVLRNDLRAAFGKADLKNFNALGRIVIFLENEAPLTCWGSEEAMMNWIDKGGLAGTNKEVEQNAQTQSTS